MMNTTLREQTGFLEALEELFSELNNRGVRYCHWKSNLRLDASLKGKTDLDLLVDPVHQDVLEGILKSRSITRFKPAPGREYPGVENWLGWDIRSGKLFHLHIHYALVLGEQFVKNYTLPLMDEYLDSARLEHGVKVPSPELELIVLSIRALLKYRDRDAVKDTLKIRKPGIPAHIRSEFDWLLSQTTPEKTIETLSRLGADLPEAEISEFLKIVRSGERRGADLYRLRNSVRASLRQYQRSNRLSASLRYFSEIRRHGSTGNLKRMSPEKCCVRVAFIGADGSGKSTVIGEITRWLSWRVTVHTYYMGSSRPTPPTRLIQAIGSLARNGHSGVRKVFGKDSALARLVEKPARLVESVRLIAEGRDRQQRYRQSLRAAQAGAVVFYDRYPLESVQVFGHALDGPRIASTLNGQLRAPVRGIYRRLLLYLMQQEEQMYREIRPPENIIVLQVSPEVSQQRKPDHKREMIEIKSQALSHIIQDGFDLNVISADQPLEQVLFQVKSAIWRLL